MPPHNLFLELFMGKKPMLRTKLKAHTNIGVDQDPDVIDHVTREYRDCGFTIVQDDAIAFLKSYRWLHSQGGELVFCDPPKLEAEETAALRHYHTTLLEILKQLPCSVMITGAWNTLYERELASWRVISYPDPDGIQEYLWMNFEKPFQLHDYRFFGNDYIERGQLRKKAARWCKRLESMPPLERYALLHALRSFTN
jgi:hypothetical protein